MFVLDAFMQHLGVNCGGIWRFELGFCICFFLFAQEISADFYRAAWNADAA